MTKKRSIVVSFIITFFLISLLVLIISAKDNKELTPMTNYTHFEKEWTEVNNLEKKGLTKSALDLVQKILSMARDTANTEQIIKALIYSMKFRSQIEEDTQETIIKELEDSLNDYTSPHQQILYSILAELYWQYYELNRYRFSQRSVTEGIDQSDIKTWDLRKLFDKIADLYQISLENSNSLKTIPISAFSEIISVYNEESGRLRPTLYDFLAHRALDFYMNEQVYLPEPANRFELTDENLFSPAGEFAKIKIRTPDTQSLKYRALLLMQNLIAFHQTDQDASALTDTDLKRISFVYANSVHPNKDQLYLKTLENLEKRSVQVPVNAMVSYKIADYYFKKGGKYIPEQAEQYKSMKQKALDVCTNAVKRFPGSIGAYNCQTLLNEIHKKILNLKTERVNLPNAPFLALLEYQNIETLYFRLVRLTETQQKKLLEERNIEEKIPDYYLKIKPEAEWNENLPVDPDYNTHSVEIKIPAVNAGFYVILTGTAQNFSREKNAVCVTPVWVSQISYIDRRNEKEGTNSIYLFDRDSGTPLSGVKAQIYEERYNYIKYRYELIKKESYKSDDIGFFKIDAYSRNIKIEFTLGDDRLMTDDYIYQSIYYPPNIRPVTTVFFTDRSIYRPGQTIYFKGLVLDSTDPKKNKIMPNYKTSVTFYDANGEKIADQQFTTNEFGTFNGLFTSPAGRLNGLMTLAANDQSGSISISVEEYKRPKFEVVFEPLIGSFKLGEKVNIKGTARAYAGSNITDAEVKFRVTRSAYFPYWYWYWGDYPSSNPVEILNGTLKTGEKGEFEITFNALPDLMIAQEKLPVFTYAVNADVTDINGETRSNTTAVRVGYTALEINLDIPATLNNAVEEKYIINSRNLNGEFEPASGTITVYRLKNPLQSYKDRYWPKPDKYLLSEAEFRKSFPYAPYHNENLFYTWEKEIKVMETPFNTAKDKNLKFNSIMEWPQGKYLLQLKTKDSFGHEILLDKYFTLFNLNEKKPPLPQLAWFSPVKTTAEPGETAAIEYGSSENNVTLIAEIERDSRIIDNKILTLSAEKRLFEIPVSEKDRGNFAVHLVFVKHNRVFTYTTVINVPWTDKELTTEFLSFRDKLQPGQTEEWKIKISGNNGEKAAAEMVATLYDASLNAFKPHNWFFNIYPFSYPHLAWSGYHAFTANHSTLYQTNWNPYSYYYQYQYSSLNWFNFSFSYSYRSRQTKSFDLDDGFSDILRSEDKPMLAKKESPNKTMMKKESMAEMTPDAEESQAPEEKPVAPDQQEQAKSDETGVQVRTNFNETAFFYPVLRTDENGEIIISFTIPEALTRWKMLGFAHTKDLAYGFSENSLVTQKELMITPNVPRFFRENDSMTISAKIANLSDKKLSGEAVLQLFDALTMKPADVTMKNTKSTKTFSVDKGLNTEVNWDISIPETLQAVTYRIIAKAGLFSDGEEAVLPVLTNRMLVTESLPLPIRKKGTKEFTFTKLLKAGESPTLQHERLTLEFTNNPVWYAIQSLPYLMEYPYECSEQIFSRLYANSIGTHIAASNPKIEAIFDQWKNTDALESNLQKNQELKSLLLEETPWVYEAQNEAERKKRIGILLDLATMKTELDKNVKKLAQMQAPNGGFPWFTGLPDNRYITQHIISGLGRLRKLKIDIIKNNQQINTMIARGIPYLDYMMNEDYQYLIRHKIPLTDDNISYISIHYLYTRSLFSETPVPAVYQTAFDYWISQAKKYWLSKSKYMQGMVALALNQFSQRDTAVDIVKSLKENSIENEELGMYWKDNTSGYYWFQAPIETQALLIETFNDVTKDHDAVEALKVWLLKQKQVQDWKTTKATVDACYALLLQGNDWLNQENQVEITIGNLKIDENYLKETPIEAGTGYFKTVWTANQIKNDMGKITLTKKEDGVSWGALYWQYFEQLDKITPHETPLKLNKKLFVETVKPGGPVIKPVTAQTALTVGDLIKVRIELTVDRDMEYVHMKDMRAANLEPLNVISRYKYQDGLWYYESTRDASTNFFFPWLAKGTYVFEYPLRITHKGNFSNGITSIQCMYAPEFTSHSEGVRITVK